MRRSDQDADDRISRSEFRGPPQQFPILDADGDGFVTKEELRQFRPRIGGNWMRDSGDRHNRASVGWYENLPIILTHTHFNVVEERRRGSASDWSGAEADALRLMDENGIRAAIIMSTPRPRGRGGHEDHFGELLRIAKKYPDRFRVSGGGESLNGTINAIQPDRVDAGDRRAFAARAEEIMAAGAVGFGELTALHFSGFPEHPFEESRPDHPLFLLLADITAKYDVPLDLHVEPVTRDWVVSEELKKKSHANPDRVRENVSALERLLLHNPKAKIIWVHVGVDNTGHRTVELTRRMLRSHRNLYLSITGFQTARENWFIRRGLGLNPDWRALILEFPDRFMIGSDAFFQPERVWHRFPQLIERATQIVRQPLLPPDVARKIAFENAQRLFRLNLIGPEEYPLPAGQPAGAVAPPASAGNGAMVGPRGLTARQIIANNDRDGDDRLSASEFRGPPPQFRTLDDDGDGFVTHQEFEAHWRDQMAR